MKEKETGMGERIRRFSTSLIVEHWVHVFAFVVLVVTGISQKFFSLDLSRWLILKLGGIDNVRLIHRCAGIVFMVAASVHIVGASVGIVLKKRQPSMVITKNDLTDAVRDLRYYLGAENSPALCDRYTYKQKFEYWGILTGGLLMIATGLVLWFPTFVVGFLPGQVIPVAKALHSNEALVIILLIAVWHIYNSIFSPEVFPLDTSIFTGYISRERMSREHPLELMRIENRTQDEAGRKRRRKARKLETEEMSR
ncbi:MAG: cytochrome b/b6 domain-containing protein [Nitrospirae bacterium]|nr:cytochrome b/b6 domain-containing protein [Nitrospirota bacterium]